MHTCEVCGSHHARDETVEEIFHIQNRYVLVENIPATVCRQCGEKTFSAETAESLRRMLNEERPPERSMPLEVFGYWPVSAPESYRVHP